MFDLPAMLLCSVASVLFPIFASYKALKTSDPAQLTPWLMYWVVLSCCLLAESWVSFIVTWIPFYGYFRLLFLLYLILPQTQGARVLYEEYVHPFLQENESHIDEFIAGSHERLKSTGLSYLRLAINYVREKFLGMPPAEPPPPVPDNVGAQGYTQALLARFSVPSARWAAGQGGGGAAAADFYGLLSSAVAAASGGAATTSRESPNARDTAASSGCLIPDHLRDSGERMSFIATQRERLSYLLTALDREAQQIQGDATPGAFDGPADESTLSASPSATARSLSGVSILSALSKSRSEADFEKIEAGSETEENLSMRRRRNVSGGTSWMPWAWVGGGGAASGGGDGQDPDPHTGASSARDH